MAIPTKPELATTKLVAVEEPTTNWGMPFVSALPFTDKSPHGEVEPTPMLPLVVKLPFEVVVALPPTQRLFETERLVVEALVNVETPETESVEVAVMLAAERLPEMSALP